jgi:transposase-like protein
VGHPLKRIGLDYYQRGLPIREIALLLGVSYNTVQLWVSCAGIARRPGKQRRRG